MSSWRVFCGNPNGLGEFSFADARNPKRAGDFFFDCEKCDRDFYCKEMIFLYNNQCESVRISANQKGVVR